MRMRTTTVSLAGAALLLVLVHAPRARAQQTDVNPPLPNVLVLVDNSGSMERMIDGTLPESAPANQCDVDPVTGNPFQPNNGNASGWTDGTTPGTAYPVPNRWGTLVQAFTGTMANGYHCAAMPRSSGSVFAKEYQIANVPPYDAGYYIPFHRPVAKDTTGGGTPVACNYAPGSLPGITTPNGVGTSGLGSGGNAGAFPASAIIQRPYASLATSTNSCQFQQDPDGAMTTMRDVMRFGVMTFDSDPDPGIGVTPSQVNTAAPFKGMWSYFPGWNTGGSSTENGNPASCATSSIMEVGARNPSAPPWEGRAVFFPTTSDLATQEASNDSIQAVVRSTRPYGATPLAGMFFDAENMFWNDPAGPQKNDGYVQGGCRNQYIILVTDGAPNLDLQPNCTGGSPAGHCPYLKPENTAACLYGSPPGQPPPAVTSCTNADGTVFSGTPVVTYVIGFAVSSFQDQGQTLYCSSLVQNGVFDPQNKCGGNPVDPLVQPCCTLQRIAYLGGSSHAYFADTAGDLQGAIGAILADIAKNTTTRTTPAYTPVSTNPVSNQSNPTAVSAMYLASFAPSPGQPWSGDVQRNRYLCTYNGSGYTIPPPTVLPAQGDDFGLNINSHTGMPRTFIAFQPDPLGASVSPTTTIRPYVVSSVGDGMGKYSATTYAGAAPGVVSNITPQAMGVNTTSCPYQPTGVIGIKYLTTTQCRDMVLDFTFGQQSDSSAPGDFTFVSRYNNALGDIFHATPLVVQPPNSLLEDPSYVGFATTWQNRKSVLYAATNDGLLHAFWTDETKLENNEMWAMLPPAVMPNLVGSYPTSHQFLLDGAPVEKDVVWDRGTANFSDPTTWHSMLVAGFGSSERGYYAVDVTNPDASAEPTSAVPTDPPAPGPVFRWQLTSMPATNAPLFGAHSATPAITTLNFDPGDGGGVREIGVAILPGGEETGPTSYAGNGPPCARAAKTCSTGACPVDGVQEAQPVAPNLTYPYRTSVRCWGATQNPADRVVGRSLVVVRVDTGEIIRAFMRKTDTTAFPSDTLNAANRIADTPLDSPMTGTPLVYPNDIGTDGKKVYIGDADGTVWRFDVSSTDPKKWFGELYLDLFNTVVDVNPTSTSCSGNPSVCIANWSDGQPIAITPVISLDPAGEVVMNVATGDQDNFTNNGTNVIYSLTEKVQGATPKLRSTVNWYMGGPGTSGVAQLQAGERVSGPMTVFNGTFYFATYAAAPAGTQSCVGGAARLWGRDYVTPDDVASISKGGLRELQPPPPSPPQVPPPIYIQPSDTNAALLGKLIPGVSIKATPACAGLGNPTADEFVPGSMHASPQNMSAGGYSLFTQIGAKGSNGAATQSFEVSLTPPYTPTAIDSWAVVVQ
jgi:type IV pilus assembly protein PilY1